MSRPLSKERDHHEGRLADPIWSSCGACVGRLEASPVHALTLTFERGVAAHVDFLEVYEADVVNPAMQGVLQATLAQLAH